MEAEISPGPKQRGCCLEREAAAWLPVALGRLCQGVIADSFGVVSSWFVFLSSTTHLKENSAFREAFTWKAGLQAALQTEQEENQPVDIYMSVQDNIYFKFNVKD